MNVELGPVPRLAFQHRRAFSPNQVGSVRLVLTPSYAKAASPLAVASTTDSVGYDISITNTGLIEVFGISVTAWGDGAGTLTCNDVDGAQFASDDAEGVQLSASSHKPLQVQGLARYPSLGLRGGKSLSCAFSSGVGQAEVSNQRGCRRHQAAEASTHVSAQLMVEPPSERCYHSLF